MKVSVRIDDVCPLIQYNGVWRAGSQGNDAYFGSYSDGGTFTLTQSNDASATINFNGTGITVYGAKRGNHNLFSTSLDGDVRTGNGQSTTGETFKQTLFTSTIPNGPHTFVIRDASTNPDPNQSYLDIDYVVLETEVDGSQNIHLEDTDDAFSYGPAGASWNTVPPQLSAFSQGSGHSTSSAQATVTLHFTGSAVDIFGLVCSTCGEYWAAVDGETPVTLTSYNKDWTKPQTLLYMARGLNDGPHKLTLTNLAANNGNMLNVDYAVVYGNNPAGGAATGNNGAGNGNGNGKGDGGSNPNSPESQNPGNTTSSNGVPIGAVVGGVVGGLVILILGLAFIYWFMRKKRREEEMAPTSPTGMHGPASIASSRLQSHPFHLPPAGPQGYGSASGYAGSVGAPSTYGGPGFAGLGAGTMGQQHPYQQQAYPQQAYHQQAYQQQGYPQQQQQQQQYASLPVGPPSHGSASLPYLQSEVSGPSQRPMSISSVGEVPPDYAAATLMGATPPVVPVRRKN